MILYNKGGHTMTGQWQHTKSINRKGKGFAVTTKIHQHYDVGPVDSYHIGTGQTSFRAKSKGPLLQRRSYYNGTKKVPHTNIISSEKFGVKSSSITNFDYHGTRATRYTINGKKAAYVAGGAALVGGAAYGYHRYRVAHPVGTEQQKHRFMMHSAKGVRK